MSWLSDVVFGREGDEPVSSAQQMEDLFYTRRDLVPQMLTLQEQYGPRFAQAETEATMNQIRQLAAQQAQLEAGAAGTPQEQQALGAYQAALGAYLPQALSGDVSDVARKQFLEARRGADVIRGLGYSGMSGAAEAQGLATLGEQFRQQALANALGAASGIAGLGGNIAQRQLAATGRAGGAPAAATYGGLGQVPGATPGTPGTPGLAGTGLGIVGAYGLKNLFS